MWYRVASVDRFRHGAFLKDKSLHVFGGFELVTPNIATSSIAKLDLERVFSQNSVLFRGLAEELGFESFSV